MRQTLELLAFWWLWALLDYFVSEELDHVRLCVVEGGVKDALCHLMVTDRGGGGCWLPPRTPSHSFVPEPRFGCKKVGTGHCGLHNKQCWRLGRLPVFPCLLVAPPWLLVLRPPEESMAMSRRAPRFGWPNGSMLPRTSRAEDACCWCDCLSSSSALSRSTESWSSYLPKSMTIDQKPTFKGNLTS